MHAVCMFHVTCMGLGRFPCVLHAFYMHVTCMQQSSIGLCFPKVLKLWITCTYISRDEVSVTCDIQNEYLCDIFSILCGFSNMHQASHVPYSRKFSPGENFAWRKFSPFSPRLVVGEIFFGELFYPVKILSHWNFYTHRFYTWLPSSTITSLVFKTSSFSIYFHVASRILPDPVGPLLSELSPSAITEVNTAVQQAKTKETKKREIDLAEDHAHILYVRANTVLVHSIFGPGHGVFFLVSNSRYGRN